MKRHPHNWIPSTLGHGNQMCSRCKMTDLEAAALGELEDCTVAPAEIPRARSEVQVKLEQARCPSCQAANVFVRQPYHDARHHAECRICDMRGPVKMSPEEAVAAWNQLPRNNAVKLIEKRIQEIVDEHGAYEPDTNSTNLPEWAETVIEELENLIEAIQVTS